MDKVAGRRKLSPARYNLPHKNLLHSSDSAEGTIASLPVNKKGFNSFMQKKQDHETNGDLIEVI